jgi:hypothetical protein
MIKSTHGAELCHPSHCINAYDETYKGKVDLSSRVVVGDPVRKSELHWAVPYNVKDDAGNEATTVWREVVVEEVDVDKMEGKIREEMKKENEAKTKDAVAAAVEAERKRIESNDNRRNSRRDSPVNSCPTCPKCGENESMKSVGDGVDDKISLAACEQMCGQRAQQCSATDQNYSVAFIVWLEQLLPPRLVFMFIFSCCVCGLVMFFRILWALIVGPSAFSANNNYAATAQERALLNSTSVTYHPSPEKGPRQPFLSPQVPPTQTSQFGGNTTFSFSPSGNSGLPPRQSMSMAQQGGDFFRSPANTPRAVGGNGFAFSPPIGGVSNGHDDIYADAATHSNDGRVRWSPGIFHSS